jgi:hypothetical protein
MQGYLISVVFQEEQIAEITFPASVAYGTVMQQIEGPVWDYWEEHYGLAEMYESRAEFRSECEILNFDTDEEIDGINVVMD